MTTPETPTPPILPTPPAMAEAAAQVEAHAPYFKVLLALFVLTVLEYGFARVFVDSTQILIFGLVLMAAMKAGLVGWYFMHLKFERIWVFLLLTPVCLLALILTVLLFPDMVMTPDPLDALASEAASAVPATPSE